MAAPPDDGATLRLFFALWPGREEAHALHALARELGRAHSGRVMREDTLHLTLAFLGERPADELERILAAAHDVCASGFELVLDTIGHWPRPQVVWLAPSQLPPALSGLVTDLRAALHQRALPVEQGAFAPHLTLLRKVRSGFRPFGWPDSLSWRVDEFVLVRSRLSAQGADYQVLARFPLLQGAELNPPPPERDASGLDANPLQSDRM